MSAFASPHIRLFTGAIMISFSPVFVNLAQVSPTTSGFYRVIIGGIALASFLVFTRRRLAFSRRAWIGIVGASVFFSLDLWFWHRSIVYIGPGLSTLLANLQVFFMMAGGIVLLGQKPSALQLVAVPLAVLGLVMIVGPDWDSGVAGYRLGVVFGVLTAMSYAGYLLCMRSARLESAHAVPVREVAVMSLMVAAILGAAAIVEGESLTIARPIDIGWMVAYGLFCHALGLMFIASSLVKVSATEVGIALLLQPSLSYVWDIVFFGRAVTPLEITGALVTLMAIFLGANLRSKQKQRAG